MGQAVDTSRHGILIVEDEPLIRHDLLDFFEDAGFEVFEAENAEFAIKLMAMQPSIRVVLTDVDMPGSMDGVKLAHYIRKRYPSTLVLIASGAFRLAVADMPADAIFIGKPFDPRAVLKTICSAPVS
ncbi:response regulator [Novosphingobium gossypii]|uniref:response regulator n=1 Tax=Novosphingobium gossypii TaxID=1604774 RepID=UPI003D1C93A9